MHSLVYRQKTMRTSTALAVFATVCVFVVAVWADSGSFDPKRVHVIDSASQGRSVLFRGSMPLENGSFCYTDLLNTMRTVAKTEAGLQLPTDNNDIFIEDVSLLSYEIKDWDVEKDYFEKYPQQGSFKLYPIIGQFLDPSSLSPSIRETLAKSLSSWQVDDLPKTMTMLNDMLLAPPPTNKTRVIYIHCEAGEDRTGEVSGSYYMRWLKWTFHAALAYDDHIETRLIQPESRNAFQWYCYNLYYSSNFTYLDCTVPKNETMV